MIGIPGPDHAYNRLNNWKNQSEFFEPANVILCMKFSIKESVPINNLIKMLSPGIVS